MQILSNLLNTLEIGTPMTSGNLTMVPLLAKTPASADYLLLDDALDAGLAEVTEVSQGGSVPELFFRNKSDKDILLIDGEELVGAKQNRVLNLTILVAAGQQVSIPVSCVEAGRWAWRSHRFASGKRNLHASARKAKMRGVSASMRESGQRSRGDIQSEVWRLVDEKLSYFDCSSGTSSLHEAYDSAEERLQPMRATFTPQPRQVGAAFFLNGLLEGLDLFDTESTLAKLLPKLVDSYAFDALELEGVDQSTSVPSLDEVRRLLARIAAVPASTYRSVAKGADVRIDQPDLHAAALVEGERVVHLSAFGTAGAES